MDLSEMESSERNTDTSDARVLQRGPNEGDGIFTELNKNLLQVNVTGSHADPKDSRDYRHRLSFNVEDDMDGLLKWITSCSGVRSKQLTENEDTETYGFSDTETRKGNMLKRLKRTLSEGKFRGSKYKEKGYKRSKSQEDKRGRHLKRQESYKEAVNNESVTPKNSLISPNTASRVPFITNASTNTRTTAKLNTGVQSGQTIYRKDASGDKYQQIINESVQLYDKLQKETNRPSPYPCQTNAQSHPSAKYRKRHEAIVNPDVYNFTYPERGYLVNIVNDRFIRQSSREGAHWDLTKMNEIARKFGFRLFNYKKDRNLTRNQTLSLLSEIQAVDHSKCDCFIFMISTHGFEQRNPSMGGKLDHALVCADDLLIFTSTILKMFNDKNCPSLKGKPKIFFIQACRGEKLDHGSDVFVLYPRSRDRTDITTETGQDLLRRKKESVDEYDTRPGGDSWAGQYRMGQVQYTGQPSTQTQSSYTSYGQQRYVGPHQIPTRPQFYAPRSNIGSTQPMSQIRSNYTISSVPFNPKLGGTSDNITRPQTDDDMPSLKCSNDMLVMYAIPQGMFAWRNASDGSWMIDYLHQILMSHNMKYPKSFLSLLTKVAAVMSRRETNTPSNFELDKKKAIPVIEHKLDKDVIFQSKVSGSPWVKRFHNMAL